MDNPGTSCSPGGQPSHNPGLGRMGMNQVVLGYFQKFRQSMQAAKVVDRTDLPPYYVQWHYSDPRFSEHILKCGIGCQAVDLPAHRPGHQGEPKDDDRAAAVFRIPYDV